MTSSTDQNDYFTQLLQNGQDNLNICPSCFENNQRKKCCANAVVLMPQKIMVCCYLGDKNSIGREEFVEKVREMKEIN